MCHHIPQATYPDPARVTPVDPYLVLLRMGFTIATNCCQLRGALLPHLFTLTVQQCWLRRFPLCCTFRRLTPPRRYLASYPAEPGLSSLRINSKSDCSADFSEHTLSLIPHVFKKILFQQHRDRPDRADFSCSQKLLPLDHMPFSEA